MKMSETISRMADEIQRRGLANGAFEDGQGRVCTLGAAKIILGSSAACTKLGKDDEQKLAVIIRAIAGFLTTNNSWMGSKIANWNDSHTQEEVVSMLRTWAAILKAREAAETPVPVVVSEAVGECVL